MLICDTHNDALLHLIEHPQDGLTDETRHVSLKKIKAGGVSLMTFAAYTSQRSRYGSMMHRSLRQIDAFYTMLRLHRGEIRQCLSPEDVIQAQMDGVAGAMLSVEGGDAIEGDLHALRMWYRLGVRMFGLCWSEDNELAACCVSETDSGLTDTGREVVKECSRLGIMLDTSHASDRSFWQTLELSERPICASHSCARALCTDQNRDMTDEMLKALGESGGYVGVNFCRPFLIGKEDRAADIEDVVRHLEHMAEKAGVQTVGIGSDYDGICMTPVGLEDCSRLPALYDALLRHGWSEKAARGVMGENFLAYWKRVFRGDAD